MSQLPEPAAPPMLPADTKDWTWSASSRCADCGFDPGAVADVDLGGALRATSARWAAVLRWPDVADRPSVEVWSPLEYACHVRDVHALFAVRVRRMLAEDAPVFASWDQDAAAVEGRYWAEDASRVADELSSAASDVADVYDAVPGDAWSRQGMRGDGGAFTVSSIGHYHLHDVIHHLHDVNG